MPNDIFSDDDAVMTSPEVVRVSGYHVDYLLRLEKAGKFPRRFKRNPSAGWKSANGWSRREVMAWLTDRKASRNAA